MSLSKKISILALISLSSIKAAEFTMEELFPPLTYYHHPPHNPELDEWRKTIRKEEFDITELLQAQNQISIMDYIQTYHYYYRCLHFAMDMITEEKDIGKKIKFPFLSSSFKLDFKKFFLHVPYPRKGDLAVYGNAKHFAYVLNENEFLSKFGSYEYIVKHPPHITPYTKYWFILRLLPKYRKNKILLAQDMCAEVIACKRSNN